MVGGLLQMVSTGKQDVYLTYNPEITFFKKIYKKHTNFSTQLQTFYPEQDIEYGNTITFKLNNCDAIHRCYLEIELPELSFNDKNIYDDIYITKKKHDKQILEKQYEIYSINFNNLNNYINVELDLYKQLNNIINIDNITLKKLVKCVNDFNYYNRDIKSEYINKIESNILKKINISDYIINLHIFDKNKIISYLHNVYNIMIFYLDKYNKNKIKTLDKINNINDYKIPFNYSKYLGHNYFINFSLEIGGMKINKYSNHVLHINQSHHINSDKKKNYDEMIGNVENLYDFNNKKKGGNKIMIPLIFWFNKHIGSCLPIISLKYSDVIISAKVNDITKIICFKDFEKMYEELLIISVMFEEKDTIVIDKELLYTHYDIDYNNKIINYNCKLINKKLLSLQFSDLLDSEINDILINNGNNITSDELLIITGKKYNNQDVLNKYNWVKMMNAISTITKNKTFYNKISSHYPYIDFNSLYSKIPQPNIKLICEMLYFDNDERKKFANSNLEYIIETSDENIFTIEKMDYFTCELSFNNLTKGLYWYIQPNIFISGLSLYGQNTELLYDIYKYFINNPVAEHKLMLDKEDCISHNTTDTYNTYTQSYKYFNNILAKGVYYIPFCLYPEESQPSGTINLKYFKSKQYYVSFNKVFISEYLMFLKNIYGTINNTLKLHFISKNYDILEIKKGKVNIIFGK